MSQWLLIAGLLASLAISARAAEGEDSYLWLENVTGDKALTWVKEQNAGSTAELTKNEAFTALKDRLLKILNSDERIPFISKDGDFYYNFWRDAKNKRGLWRRTTLEEYRKAKPAWETVLDLDALAEKEKENWVWKGADFLQPSYDRCLLSLSRGGADATVVREFDVKSKTFVKDGFVLPEAKSRVAWRGPDSLFVGTDFGPGSLTQSGYPRIVKEWKRGTPLTEAKLVFEGKPEDVAVGAVRDLARGFERDFVSRAIDFWKNELFLRRDGKLIKIEKPDDASASAHRDLLFIQLRSDWTVGDKTYPAGALLATDFDAYLAGKRRFDVLFEPTDRKSLAGYSPTRNHVLLNELDNVQSRLYVLTRKDGVWQRQELPGAPKFSTVSASAVDADESDDYFLTVSGYLTPSSLFFGTVGKGAAGEAQGDAGLLQDGRVRGQPARGHLEGRHPHSLLPGITQGPVAGRQQPHAALRLWRLPDSAGAWLPGDHRDRLAGKRRRLRRGQHPRRRRVRSEGGTRPPSRPTGARPTRISSPWPRT